MEKLIDMFQYHDRIKFCCCINSWSDDDSREILERTMLINKMLEQRYVIGLNDDDDFIGFYRLYKAWLLEKYLDESCLFWRSFTNCFSLKNRKKWKTADFKSVFYGQHHYILFFAQTFCVFAKKKLRELRFLHAGLGYTEPLVAHKMYYGALLILNLIGYRIDVDINEEKAILDSLITTSADEDYK